MGVGKNGGGKLISTKECTLPHLGELWFIENSMTNVIALSHMTDKFRVTMVSNIENVLFVHLPDKIVKFKQLNNNLYDMNSVDSESYISKDEFKRNNKIHRVYYTTSR